MNSPYPTTRFWRGTLLAALVCLLIGCGKTKIQTATEQLLSSNAVDRVVAQIDFTALNQQKVFFDDQYIKNVKAIGFVNSEYIISSLRQQMMAAGCLLQDRKEDADYIVEGRVGTLGTDQHEVSFGIPANNLLNAAGTAVTPAGASIPAIPEISFAKKEHHVGAAKIGLFAYHRETRQAVWQAGVVAERSRSKEAWLLGIGPYQSGTIYDEPMFAGTQLNRPMKTLLVGKGNNKPTPKLPPVNYRSSHMFPLAYQMKVDELRRQKEQKGEVEWANHEETQKELKALMQQIESQPPQVKPE